MSHQEVASIISASIALNCVLIFATGALWLRLQEARTKYKLAKLSWMKVRDSSKRILEFLERVIEDTGSRVAEDYEGFIIGQISKMAMKADELERIKDLLKERNQIFPPANTADIVYSLCVTEQLVQANWMIPMEIQPRSRAMLKAFFQKVADKYLEAQKKRIPRRDDPEGWLELGKSWTVAECQESVLYHIAKGDPVDVAIYCAFLSWHEEETSLLNYISVTPALEALIQGVVRNIPEGTDLSTIAPVESKMQPEFKRVDEDAACEYCPFPKSEHHCETGQCPDSMTSLKWRETKFAPEIPF